MRVAWSLRDSGYPALSLLRDDNIAELQAMLAQFKKMVPATPPAAECKVCETPTPGYMALMGDGPDDLLIVLWNGVRIGKELLIDPSRKFYRFFHDFFLKLQPVREIPKRKKGLGEIADQLMTALRLEKDDPGEIWFSPCECGGPADFNDWSREHTLLENSCYNYAVKDRRVGPRDPLGGATGAYASGDKQEWREALEDDGLIWVPDWNTQPTGAHADGWHLVLALEQRPFASNYHFLRLDVDHWSHKWSLLPPQLCDLSGNYIPKDGIREADICGYEIADFYWANPPIHAH